MCDEKYLAKVSLQLGGSHMARICVIKQYLTKKTSQWSLPDSNRIEVSHSPCFTIKLLDHIATEVAFEKREKFIVQYLTLWSTKKRN